MSFYEYVLNFWQESLKLDSRKNNPLLDKNVVGFVMRALTGIFWRGKDGIVLIVCYKA
jgi:uncharacterized membrane protein